jgi:hypothetical protein
VVDALAAGVPRVIRGRRLDHNRLPGGHLRLRPVSLDYRMQSTSPPERVSNVFLIQVLRQDGAGAVLSSRSALPLSSALFAFKVFPAESHSRKIPKKFSSAVLRVKVLFLAPCRVIPRSPL